MLHQEKMENLETEALMDYLLSCQDYLKENDLLGWKKTFAPDTVVLMKEPPKKRQRMSPNALRWQPLPNCKECQSPDVIEDVAEGSVVCTACGIIQSMQLLGTDPAFMSVDMLKNAYRHVVHRYSRVVYFRSLLLGLQGKTVPSISIEELASLRRTIVGEGSAIHPSVVWTALKKLGLGTKYRRHLEALAVKLSGGLYSPVEIEVDQFFELLTLFRRVECEWDHGVKQTIPTRRVFLSYPYIYYQLCHHIGSPHLTGSHHLLKSVKLLNVLHKVYKPMSEKLCLKITM